MKVLSVTAILVSLLATSMAPVYAKSTPLNIVVDIPFVASLAQDLVGPGEVITTLVNSNESPHTFSLRPRAVRALQSADLVITVSEALSPNITRAVSNVSDGRSFSLDSAPLIETLPARNQHDHGSLRKEDEYKSMNLDPHIWLSPVNVQLMVEALRDELIAIAPLRATQFKQSAARMTEQLQEFDQQQKSRWEHASNRSFVSLHDATYYFENHYQLTSKGSLFANSHTAPGVQQLKAMQEIIESENIDCIVTDALSPPGWINTLAEGSDVKVVSIDVLGFDPVGANFMTTLNQVSDSFAQCLGANAE